MKGVRALLTATGIGLIGYAIYRYYRRQIDFIKEYQYKVVGLRIMSLRKDNITFDVRTRVFNNSNVEATVKEVILNLYLNGVKVGNIDEVKDTFIKARGSSDFTFQFSFNPQVVLGNLFSIATLTIAAKDVLIEINGYVKVKSAFVQATIPFAYQNNLKSLIQK